jgi:hypothetical protein
MIITIRFVILIIVAVFAIELLHNRVEFESGIIFEEQLLMDSILSSKYCINSFSRGLIGEENVFTDVGRSETRLDSR